MRTFLHQKTPINYLYFSCFFLFITLLTLSHFLMWDLPAFGSYFFFTIYTIGQAALEVGIFIFIGYMIKNLTYNWVYLLFTSLSFIFLLLQYTHHIFIRIMDASLVQMLRVFQGSGIAQLLLSVEALNLTRGMQCLILGSFIAIPFVGIAFYRLTAQLIRRKPLCISLSQVGLACLCTGGALLLLEYGAGPKIAQPMLKKLPFGTTLLTQAGLRVTCPPHLFPSLRNEQETLKNIPELHISPLPNIYLFVIETLRRDCMTDSIAPHLHAFAQENIQFKHSFANANATHLSWFSIFHSDLPSNWTEMRENWSCGSIPLQYLKKLGYEITEISAADLRFFKMDTLLFGKQRQLTHQVEDVHLQNGEPCDRDLAAFDAFKQHLTPNGHVYLIFLDSTHSEYNFPKDFPLPFTPIAKGIDYLTINPKSPDLELIKNRYRNAVHFVDHLMGRFFSLLKETGLYDDAIIAVTGDHGEEFFEEGSLFHGTHLNHYQTSVPLFFKFPSQDWIPQTDTATHIDIFPSILHYLTDSCQFSSLFDGESIFSPHRRPFRIAFQQNGSEKPCEFILANETNQLHMKFIDANTLELIE